MPETKWPRKILNSNLAKRRRKFETNWKRGVQTEKAQRNLEECDWRPTMKQKIR